MPVVSKSYQKMLEVKGASFSIVAPSLARQTALNEWSGLWFEWSFDTDLSNLPAYQSELPNRLWPKMLFDGFIRRARHRGPLLDARCAHSIQSPTSEPTP